METLPPQPDLSSNTMWGLGTRILIIPHTFYGIFDFTLKQQLQDKVGTEGTGSYNCNMKSTKVQNPRRVESCELCQCACAEIGHASRCSCNAWCCQFSLQQGPAASFWARLNGMLLTIVGQAGYSPAVLQP